MYEMDLQYTIYKYTISLSLCMYCLHVFVYVSMHVGIVRRRV